MVSFRAATARLPPNGQFSCAQLASILAKLLKLPAAENAGFADNKRPGLVL